ncbi:sodium-dependent nutrient amino acid transporter 1-like isoform X1 [Diorhabda carinulata]|uniref:sodium-dependent nutrient amino acid transporter 1-like isoform X1 n=1 Tax=Diorhabda carinulata TaxID=1163345 RepID=UPI0025A2F920|nr:sodium-dependent nutrient amino acid transporter 1-like isoform X1 [Diorhabda carinulata]
MRGKWNNNEQVGNGNSTIPRTGIDFENIKFKHIRHSPSLRAIKTYNDLPVEGNFQNDIDLRLYTPPKYDTSSMSRMSVGSRGSTEPNNIYEVVKGSGTMSVASGSEYTSEINEMGSTSRLVPTKIEQSCQTILNYISTTLCTISMALGLGNLYRLPQTTMIRGGLPFLIAHLILTIFIGLPLIFLELGMGQLAEEGFIKSWRVIPFFRGIGYVKFLAGYMLSIYYPLYMGLSLYYVIWIWKGSIPLQECSSGVKITEDGYSFYGKNGQQCLRSTFLKSIFEDPYWFGIFAMILFVIWIISTILTIGKTKGYIRSLIMLFFPTVGCLIALLANSVMNQTELANFFIDADWSLLESPNVWYYAIVQVFFSSTVGFGSFVTNAGIIYNKVNPFWTAFGYCAINTIFGIGSTVISQSLSNHTRVNVTPTEGDVAEILLVSLIYDMGSASTASDKKIWTILIFVLFILAGLISMATLSYTLLKAITVGSRARLGWWQASLLLSISGFIFGCLILLKTEFDIVHLLDHYIVGNLILITSILEVLTLLTFYGAERIRSDFEFMLGHILSRFWLILWWISPMVMTGLFAWGMTTLPLEGIFKDDAVWVYGIGWGVVLTATLLIFVIGIYVVCKQDGYTFIERFKTSLKPSKNWGPKDPISRHNWIQWNSKTQSGERDFTLKRKGTKDYTKSIKRNKKLMIADKINEKGLYTENKQQQIIGKNNIYAELNQARNGKPIENRNGQFKVISLTDSLDSSATYYTDKRIPRNPLARREFTINGAQPDEYGTFRKGPYIIQNNVGVDHVCLRKLSDNEDATDL